MPCRSRMFITIGTVLNSYYYFTILDVIIFSETSKKPSFLEFNHFSVDFIQFSKVFLFLSFLVYHSKTTIIMFISNHFLSRKNSRCNPRFLMNLRVIMVVHLSNFGKIKFLNLEFLATPLVPEAEFKRVYVFCICYTFFKYI